MEFSALIYGQRGCGQHIGMTKKKFYWAFRVNQKGHTLEIYSSRLTGKRTLVLDEVQIYQQEKTLNPFKRMVKENFKYSLVLNGFRILVEENGREFSCFVDGIDFKTLVGSREKIVKKEQGKDDGVCEVELGSLVEDTEGSLCGLVQQKQ